MSEANHTSDESPVRPVVRMDATIRPEVPARSHEVQGDEAIRALEKVQRRLKYLWKCANWESLSREEMLDRIDRISWKVQCEHRWAKLNRPSPAPSVAEEAE